MRSHRLVDQFLRPLVAKRVVNLLLCLGVATGVTAHAASSQVQRVGAHLGTQLTTKASSVEILDLYSVWLLGFTRSPYAKIALSRYAEHQEQRAISRAGLLPAMNASYSRSRVHGWRQYPGRFGQVSRSDLRYDSSSFSMQLQQPLLNYASYAEYQRGKAVAEFGATQLGVDQEKLSLQLTQIYFKTLLAYEDWRMQHERLQFLTERLDTFNALARLDNATQLEVEETAARLAVAEAELLVAADTLRENTLQLASYLGSWPQWLRQLQPTWHYAPLEQNRAQLLEQGRQHNRSVQLVQKEIAIYQARLEAARSQYFPTVSLGLSLNKANSEDLATLSQRTNTVAVGLNVAIPLFSGGYTRAATSQARFQLTSVENRYRAVLAKTEADIQKQFGLYTSGAARVASLQKAVESSRLSLDSMLKSFSVGAANNLDVLNAQDQLVATHYEYYQARLDVLLAQLQLQALVGEPLHQAVQTMSNQYFDGEVVALPNPLRFEAETTRAWTLTPPRVPAGG